MNILLLAALGTALILMIALPLTLIVVLTRRRGVPGRVSLVAAGFYLLNLAVNAPLTAFVWPKLFGTGSWSTLLATCLTYGVCEELARYASFRWVPVMRRHRDDSGAVAAGLGHGGAESILFGLQLGAAVLLVTLSGTVPAGMGAPTPLEVLMAGVDRLPALAGQVAFAVLVVLAFRRSRWFLLVAIGVHGAVDFIVFGIQKAVPGYGFEIVFVLIGVAALLFVRTMLRRPELARLDGPVTVGVAGGVGH